jgi:hypothetical protein|tara:strand:- start:136 stop:360 length:225 start_codon:yes stop_codon:yes gene_type:complete
MSDAMGFHKRWINIENIISIYKREGLEAVKSYLHTPDAYIVTDDESDIILDIYQKGSDKKLIKEIEKCISTEEK